VRNPFIAGSWVRGENFFGRQSLLREILEGDRDTMWVVGARRLGKTSLMKELEYRVHQSAQSPWAPLYWDLEGSADARGLADSLLGSIEDSEAYRRVAGIAVEDVEGLSVIEMLTALVRRTLRSGFKLLILIDEADLDTSPFLQGFSPPLYLTPLLPEDARALLARGRFPSADVERILERTGGHPFLVQLIASRLFESQNVDSTLEQVGSDEMVGNFFSVDFQTLEPTERFVLEEVAREQTRSLREIAQAARLTDDDAEPILFGLRMMGYLTSDGARYRVGNWFFERWLRRTVAARADARA
jgi:hypothetical protein